MHLSIDVVLIAYAASAAAQQCYIDSDIVVCNAQLVQSLQQSCRASFALEALLVPCNASATRRSSHRQASLARRLRPAPGPDKPTRTTAPERRFRRAGAAKKAARTVID